MMHEHEEHDQAIARLEELTNNFELPEGVPARFKSIPVAPFKP